MNRKIQQMDKKEENGGMTEEEWIERAVLGQILQNEEQDW